MLRLQNSHASPCFKYHSPVTQRLEWRSYKAQVDCSTQSWRTYGFVAQLAVQLALNEKVVSSILTGITYAFVAQRSRATAF